MSSTHIGIFLIIGVVVTYHHYYIPIPSYEQDEEEEANQTLDLYDQAAQSLSEYSRPKSHDKYEDYI